MGVKTRKLGNINNQIVEWQSVHVSDGSTALTTVAGRGYFINTTSGAQTVNLPGTPRFGDRVSLKDFARTWGTNKITMGSNKFDGVSSRTPEFDTNGQTVSLIYMGSAQGWSLINEDTTTGLGAQYVTATGGTVTTSGDFKIHTFTGDSNFVVSNAGNPAGSTKVSYLVVAGGGGGGGAITTSAGAGGAGGFREGKVSGDPYSASPLVAPDGLSVSAQTYPVTVGGGGAAGAGPVGQPNGAPGDDGSNSVFSTITSTGGGGGAREVSNGENGGSGGGGGGIGSGTPSGGSGNTPPVSPPQGNNGGTGGANPKQGGGGGGGATAAGGAGSGSAGGAGGAGATSSINGTPTARAGGGGGSVFCGGTPDVGAGGTGGGGAGGYNANGTAGTANTGGGGGGSGGTSPPGQKSGGVGGKGIVILRYKFQN